MRAERPERPPYALTVASTDSGGGAGIAADLKTMTRLGVYGGCVVVAVTAQHTRGVESTHVLPRAEVEAQFDAVVDDFDVGAVKTGMLATEAGVRAATERLAAYDGPVVVDPVLVSTAGDVLLEPDALSAYDDLIAAATLVTPNADEAAELTGIEPDSAAAVEAAANDLLDRGANAVLLKGGHRATGDEVRDTLVTGSETRTITSARVATERTHGSGCTLSAAVAARLAHGDALPTAVERAIQFTGATIERPADVGRGPGSVNHLVDFDTAFGDRA